MTFARSPLRSAIALCFAIVQMGAAAAFPIADGQLEARAAASAAYAHIEAHGTPDCPRVHLENCTLCRGVHADSERAMDAGGPAVTADRGTSGACRSAPLPVRPAAGPVCLRAPPGATAPRSAAA